MIQHDDQGAMGVVLNRPADVSVAQVWDEIFAIQIDVSDPIYIGGPVEGPLILLHSILLEAETEILPDVCMSLEKSYLQAVVGQNRQPWRLFSGYSGWGPQQLEMELEAGGWLTLPAHSDLVFSQPEDLWKKVCNQVGTGILKDQIKGNLPSDPSLN